MAQVSITINGRSYKMSCDDGQEAHLLELAEIVNSRVETLINDFGQVGDSRLFLMAGIMIADELKENIRRSESLNVEIKGLQSAKEVIASRVEQAQDSVAETLTQAAMRIERLNEKLQKDH